MRERPLLRLPKPDLSYSASGDRFLDPVRRRWIRMTPEEWVRQHAIVWLTDAVQAPASLLSVEKAHNRSGMSRRTDVTVHDRDGAPWMIVECKAPEVPVTQSALDQVAWYAKELKPSFVAVTNGLVLYVASRSPKGEYNPIRELPIFPSP